MMKCFTRPLFRVGVLGATVCEFGSRSGFDAVLGSPDRSNPRSRDIKIFETLFWTFSKEYKYTAKTYEIFEKRSHEIAPWLDEPFEFETRLFGKFFDDSNPINDNPIFLVPHIN